jgi:hypothetical protein
MYKLRYWSTGQRLISKIFPTLSEALLYSVYNIPFQSFHTLDKVEE